MEFWQKKVIESESTESLLTWLRKDLSEILPAEIDQNGFVELIRENIVFPKDAADYAKNLFVHSFFIFKILLLRDKTF